MIHSFLLIGQSNMGGRGYLHEVAPICDDRLLVLRNGRWQKLYAPVNPDRQFSGVNLAESFALAYADHHPNVQVGLIPCADGGSSLEQWQAGGLLFDHAVYQCRLALRTSSIAGVLWHQGESDSDSVRVSTYLPRLAGFVQSLRADLGVGEEVPFIAGQIQPRHEHAALFNPLISSVSEVIPNAAGVSSEGLSTLPDNLHFTREAQLELGRRYADALFGPVEDSDKSTLQ